MPKQLINTHIIHKSVLHASTCHTLLIKYLPVSHKYPRILQVFNNASSCPTISRKVEMHHNFKKIGMEFNNQTIVNGLQLSISSELDIETTTIKKKTFSTSITI